jgi:hypothetical protein
MNARRHPEQSSNPFAGLPKTPASHFELYFYTAAHQLLTCAGGGGSAAHEAACDRFPFLVDYWDELSGYGLDGLDADEAAAWWDMALRTWEADVKVHLPLRALREEAALDTDALTLLFSLGLPEEDARFGLIFEHLQGVPGQHRPTMGLLTAWWRRDGDPAKAKATLRRLIACGLVQVLNPDAPRSEWALQPPALIWDALRGEAPADAGTWLRYRAARAAPTLEDLILPEETRRIVETLPVVLAAGEAQAVVVRGPQHNGRRTMLAAIARALGRGVVEIAEPEKAGDERWRQIGPLATLLRALPTFVYDLAPGETAKLPALSCYSGPVGIVLGRQGGVSGPDVGRALTVMMPMPDIASRREHWRTYFVGAEPETLSTIGERFRLTSGNIRRAGAQAHSYAALSGHVGVTLDDARQAARALNRQALDTLAVHVTVGGDWSHLAVDGETRRELNLLETRCRHRERLPGAVGVAFDGQLGPGVRALFTGPSGTGKTLAARLLAAALGMDLYRLDLGAVVNKYIGETEKNLSQVFARAEELDVILLLDEGDALLTQRTSVQSANDRYANLETNYLLQRLEVYEGILIVTTNAVQRIDDAFQRRMDVVVTFHPPDVAERAAIWRLHLPAQHTVPPELLDEITRRCALSGGQIRNAAMHAALLALDDGSGVAGSHVEAAVRREYRKLNAVCPLRTREPSSARWE